MRIEKKFIKLGTGSDEISGSDVPANHSATNYTASNANIDGHLDGIDTAIGLVPQQLSGDLNEVSFSLANNQAVFVDVTGVSFNNANTRSIEIQYSIVIDATADLYESGKIMAVQRGADYEITHQVNGDNSLIVLDIDTSGQLQYKSASYAGFVSATIKVRAVTTSV